MTYWICASFSLRGSMKQRAATTSRSSIKTSKKRFATSSTRSVYQKISTIHFHPLTRPQFTSEFDDFTTSLHMVAIGIDANTKGITKRVLYVVEQIFFGIDFIRHRPLRTLVPVCKDKAEDNAKKILENLKILIRAYGGTTECSRLGGPMVNSRKTCAGSGHSTWELPGGIQF